LIKEFCPCFLAAIEIKVNMSITNKTEDTGENLLADDKDWTAILEPALCTDAAAVEVLALLLFRIKKAIDSGPEGATRASQTLLALHKYCR
jgi:hypothetical protein